MPEFSSLSHFYCHILGNGSFLGGGKRDKDIETVLHIAYCTSVTFLQILKSTEDVNMEEVGDFIPLGVD